MERIVAELAEIRADMLSSESRAQRRLEEIHANHRESARNLIHYLALRRRDVRPLQRSLAALGLSSLGRSESNVLASIDVILGVLTHLLQPDCVESSNVSHDFSRGERLLAEHTSALLGPAPAERSVRIMVTMPSEAADDYLLVHQLLQQGMDCMRINCAHDDDAAWMRMIENLRRAEQSLGRSCRVFMDLAGPKLRTGPIEPGPAVVKVRPERNAYGRVIAPARIWLSPEDAPCEPPSAASARLPVPASWLLRLRAGERVAFTDARGSKRSFTVVDTTDRGCWAEADRTAYIVSDTRLRRVGHGRRIGGDECRVGTLPSREGVIALKKDDLLIVTRDLAPGRPAVRDSAGAILSPATIGCTIPELFDHAHAGEPIWFDDGKIGGVIESVTATRVRVRVTQDHLTAVNLRADKGINLPESDLHIAALTDKDIEDLSFVARHADIVGLSFANSAQDVASLQQQLESMGGRQPAIVLKIETRRGFESLPDMLLTAMRASRCGVMIARGDLAVECRFERLAEVQEEILWLCEAAHVPVIWATQVLETLAKEGRPSRAEITDAAAGLRAECVMLNKGPYVLSAVRALDDILRRMRAHQAKKRSMLRALRLAQASPIESEMAAAGQTLEPAATARPQIDGAS
ncbi:MAG TPA: pyruvate kinase [Thiobacillaceae bacterium]|nr:pyruvate kinase [Thiobacillaceae bacterium]